MAQHISIIENNLFPKIEKAIQSRFSKKNIGLSSFLYEELNSDEYKQFPNCRVFLNKRKIGKQEELFEIHFDTTERKVIDIFLVK
ncbi:hypothetical protein [Flavobacterium sp.]|jgi:hypothetical protein|uniref:hypothetical protein n=1 Tax=Flavobacterium sp. TaxID=239 RepID=UPI002CC45F54|nr:hypothetical protein [Flavobacterium sp.]HQA74234.1 hypothetical protein [Flavobacterium sp.]